MPPSPPSPSSPTSPGWGPPGVRPPQVGVTRPLYLNGEDIAGHFYKAAPEEVSFWVYFFSYLVLMQRYSPGKDALNLSPYWKLWLREVTPARKGERVQTLLASVFSSPPLRPDAYNCFGGSRGEGGHKRAPKESPFLTGMSTLPFRDGSPGASAARRDPGSRPRSPRAAQDQEPSAGLLEPPGCALEGPRPAWDPALCAAQSAAMARP